MVSSCEKDKFDDREVEIPEFNFQKTVVFKDSLSLYEIFHGTPSDLIPSAHFELLELSAALFTDYSHKQRLVKIPDGTQMTSLKDNTINFPNGTILTKTFFYYNDERDTSLGKTIIETRLLIKENDQWNAATYRWNASQTDAILQLNGSSKKVTWINSTGTERSTLYKIPSENECMSCHQLNASMTPLGPTLLNLNREITRGGFKHNQISYLQSIKLLNNFSLDQIPQMADYSDVSIPLADRGRSYLAINCAHCHNPNAWETPAEKDFDFRHETPLEQTGIIFAKDKIIRNVINREMPFIGTTIMDQEGISLLIEYIESL